MFTRVSLQLWAQLKKKNIFFKVGNLLFEKNVKLTKMAFFKQFKISCILLVMLISPATLDQLLKADSANLGVILLPGHGGNAFSVGK